MNIFQTLHTQINIPLLQYFNSLTEYEWLANIIYVMADAPIFIIPLFLVIWWFYFNIKKNQNWKEKLLFIFYSTIIAILISSFIQQFVDLDRPETSLHNAGKLILNHIPDNSFPSDHASVGMAFISSLYLFGFQKIAFIFLPIFMFMLFSRIAGWVHWPFDVGVWIIVWIISGILISKLQKICIFQKINTLILKLTSYFKL